MKTNVLLICILISHVFAACSTKNNSSNVSTIELNPDYEKNSFVFEDVFKTVKSIPLETNSNSIIGGVSKLIESNRSLFIMDDKNNKIVRFDLQGKYLNSIGTPGHGPGEFLKVKDFTIDDTNQQVSVYDVRGRKIIIYNFEGSFIYEFSIDFFLNSIAIDDSGNYYGFTGSISNRSHADSEVLNKLKFIKFDNNGNKKSEKLFESSSLPASLKTKSTFFTPKHIDNNYIYSAQTTFYLHERYNQDKNDKKTSEARIKDWESFIQKVNIDDNPVIFRYEFAKDIY